MTVIRMGNFLSNIVGSVMLGARTNGRSFRTSGLVGKRFVEQSASRFADVSSVCGISFFSVSHVLVAGEKFICQLFRLCYIIS